MAKEDDFEIQRNFELGEGAGWEDAGKRLMDEATAYFILGNDSMATSLRTIGKDFLKKGSEILAQARNKTEAKE